MLPSRLVIFSAVEGSLIDPASRRWSGAEEALDELERRHVPLVLCTSGTRAQLEPLRAKIGNRHPFVTERGGGLFVPDAYFTMKLEGAHRVGRYFCVPCANDYTSTVAALAEIAEEAGADVLGFSQMSAREIARNTGESSREAESAREREFSETFFFVGERGATAQRFARIAGEHGWRAIPGSLRGNSPGGDVFWELTSNASPERAIRHIMRLYQAALHHKPRAIGIGSAPADLGMLSAVNKRFVLPRHGEVFEDALTSALPGASRGVAPGPEGWNQAVLAVLAEAP